MNFKQLDINDRYIFEEFLNGNGFYNKSNYESTFAVLFCFRDDVDFRICVTDKALFIARFNGKQLIYYPPIVKQKEHFIEAVFTLDDYAKSRDEYFILEGVTDDILPLIMNSSRYYTATTDRKNYEYLYKPTRLMSFSEETQLMKYRQVKAFNKRVKYTFRPYEKRDFNSAVELLTKWERNKGIDKADHIPMIKALEHYDELGLTGAVIEVKNKLSCIALAKIDRNNNGLVLFEKADHKLYGSNVALVAMFANEYLKDCNFVNRQEDVGDLGLRYSKLSYLPTQFIVKYCVTRGKY